MPIKIPDAPTIGNLEDLFQNVVSVALAFAGIVLLLMLVIGGLNLITAGSDSSKAEASKKTITYAILGFVFVVMGFLILTLVSNFTGVQEILKFKIVQ